MNKATLSWVVVVLTVVSAPYLANAGSLQQGDQLVYTGGTMITFESPTRQVYQDGAVIMRDAAGRRTHSRGWNNTPHDGEFPDDGRLTLGDQWRTEVSTEKDGERFSHTRDCSVVAQDSRMIAELIFKDALRVDCTYTTAGNTYQTYSAWYWQDENSFEIVLEGTINHQDRGTTSFALQEIRRPGGTFTTAGN